MSTRVFETIAVVGAGTMGAQIALQCAVNHYPVRLYSRSAATLERAAQGHARELEQRLKKQLITADEKESILDRIQCTTQLQEAVAGADPVIDSAPEQPEIKRGLFAQLDRLCPPHAVLATNGSSFRIPALEHATGRPGPVLDMHFYLPVWQRPMVELMRGTATTAGTTDRLSPASRRA